MPERAHVAKIISATDILVRHLINDQHRVLSSFERLAAVRAALA
jgi:hypothetical protein